MGKQVFISYSSANTEIALKIFKYLEANGISCWIAVENILASEEYNRKIPPAIRECDFFLLLYTKEACQSEYVSTEIDLAKEYKRKIINVRLQEIELSEEHIIWLKRVQWLDLVGKSDDFICSEIRNTIDTLKTIPQLTTSIPIEPQKPDSPLPKKNKWSKYIVGIIIMLVCIIPAGLFLLNKTQEKAELQSETIDNNSDSLSIKNTIVANEENTPKKTSYSNNKKETKIKNKEVIEDNNNKPAGKLSTFEARKQLAEIGISWSANSFAEALSTHDFETANLFMQGKMDPTVSVDGMSVVLHAFKANPEGFIDVVKFLHKNGFDFSKNIIDEKLMMTFSSLFPAEINHILNTNYFLKKEPTSGPPLYEAGKKFCGTLPFWLEQTMIYMGNKMNELESIKYLDKNQLLSQDYWFISFLYYEQNSLTSLDKLKRELDIMFKDELLKYHANLFDYANYLKYKNCYPENVTVNNKTMPFILLEDSVIIVQNIKNKSYSKYRIEETDIKNRIFSNYKKSIIKQHYVSNISELEREIKRGAITTFLENRKGMALLFLENNCKVGRMLDASLSSGNNSHKQTLIFRNKSKDECNSFIKNDRSHSIRNYISLDNHSKILTYLYQTYSKDNKSFCLFVDRDGKVERVAYSYDQI